MDIFFEKLKEYGADIEGAMRRFLNDTELYKMCFATLVEDEAFYKLGETLKLSDFSSAFEYAHSLKGTSGNMGLTPLYTIVCKLVENLRNKEYSNLQSIYENIVEQLHILKEI